MSRSPRKALSDDAPRVEITSRAELRAWLVANHATSGTIWLVTFKKGDPRHVPWGDIVDEALCFGWIDSLPRALDARRTMLRLSPRKSGSAWSAINRARVARLIAEGKMTPTGLAVIDQAKADGSYDRLAPADTLDVPPDLEAAFGSYPGAREQWEAFPPSARRAILEWNCQAKRAETRANRVTETARLAAEGKRANSWPRS